MNRPLDKHDLEPLLISREIESFSAEEMAFLRSQLGDLQQIRAYRSMLLLSISTLSVSHSKLEPSAVLKQQIRLRMKQNIHKGGVEAVLVALLSILPFGKNGVQVAMATLLMVLIGWSGSHYNHKLVQTTTIFTDSLTYHLRYDAVRMLADSSRNLPLMNDISMKENFPVRRLLNALKD